MKESTAYLQMAEYSSSNAQRIARVIDDVTSRYPESDERNGVIRELANLRRAAISLQGRALHAAEIALIDPEKDRDVKDPPSNPVKDIIDEVMRPFRESLQAVCPCDKCKAKRAAANVDAKPEYAVGEKVEWRCEGSNEWRPGEVVEFEGGNTDSLLRIGDSGSAATYLVRKFNVRKLPVSHPGQNGDRRFRFGDKIQFHFRNEDFWRDGTFNGYASDGSGSLLVMDQVGNHYRASPEAVRWHPSRRNGDSSGAPSSAAESVVSN